MELKDMVVVVTGSSSGIGKAVALNFAKAGARVVVNSKMNVAGGQDTVDEITRARGKATYIQADLTNPESVKNLFDQVYSVYATVDILINNAGRTVGMPFLESTKEHWLEQIEVNFISTVLCSIEAARKMKKQGYGKIINTASVRGLGHTGRPGIMAYSAAKAAVINFTKTLAKELAPDVTVNAVAPGFVDTPYMNTVSAELKEQWLSNIPLKRFISTNEIADAYLYLARSDIVTGEILIADAGFTLKIA